MSKEAMKQALEALVESLDDVRECLDNLIPSSASYDRCVKYYEQQIDRHEAAITTLRQALADAALDKMAENARELGLSYEQPAQQEPDPDELTIAYMSGLHEGKKRKPWVDLTVTEQNELCRELGASRHQVRAIEAKLKERNT